MRISASQLQGFSEGPAPLPPPVEPPLSLAEEVVLLSLDAPRRLPRHVVRIVGRAYPDGPRDYDTAVRALRQRGLLDHGTATPRAQLARRTARVRATIGRAAPPEGRDAELLMLLAATGSLPIGQRADHLHARTRLASVVDAPPPAVIALANELGLEPRDLVDRLLPPARDASGHQFGSSVYPSLGGA